MRADDPAPPRERTFIPALRFSALTPLFDPVARLTTRERTMKNLLLDAAAVRPGESVLDIGAGTGTLAVWLKERVPQAKVTGLDADPAVLVRARRKTAAAGHEVDFVEGFSTDLPFPNDSFDVVLSSLVFHHIPSADKRTTLAEIVRVLKPGGRLHVADFGRPKDPLMAAMFLVVRTVDGFEVTRDNARGALPDIFDAAGLADVRTDRRLRAPLGTMALYSGRKPAL